MFEEKMTNCPRCRKPILNGGVFTSPAKFTIRCPWCQVTLAITIMPKIIAEIVKMEHESNIASHNKSEQECVPEKESGHKETVRMNESSQGFKVVGYMYPADSPAK